MTTSNDGHMPQLSRRSIMKGGAAALSLLVAHGQASAAANVIDVTASPYNASPNILDNASAFQAALNTLCLLGGGVLLVPPGLFSIGEQLTYSASSGSLTIAGYGSGLSVLVIRHQGAALNVVYSSAGSPSLTVKDVGFSPASLNGPAGTAIVLTMPAGPSAWPSCRIENVDFGAASPGYTVFTTALALTNVWRSNITQCNAQANRVNGNVFLSLNGLCIDNQITDCSIAGYENCVTVGAYSEGLHITNTVFSGGRALTTGLVDFNNGINLLGLYISGCRFNCQGTALWLYQVNSGWVSDTSIGGPEPRNSSVACAMIGCCRVKVANCLFIGLFSAAAPTNQVGIETVSSTRSPSYSITIDDCSFENTLTALVLGGGTFNVTCMKMRLFAPGLSTLINVPLAYGKLTMQPLIDNSGNYSNTGEWISSVDAVNHKLSSRTVFSK